MAGVWGCTHINRLFLTYVLGFSQHLACFTSLIPVGLQWDSKSQRQWLPANCTKLAWKSQNKGIPGRRRHRDRVPGLQGWVPPEHTPWHIQGNGANRYTPLRWCSLDLVPLPGVEDAALYGGTICGQKWEPWWEMRALAKMRAAPRITSACSHHSALSSVQAFVLECRGKKRCGSTMGKHEEPESRAVAQSCGKHRGEKSHLYSSEPIWGEHTDLRNMFSPGCCLAGESVEEIYKLSDSWGKCLKVLNLFIFSRKSGNDPIAQCMGTKEEKTEIYLSLGCRTCIREHYLACLFLTFSISKLEITFAQVQEVYWAVL